MPCGAAWARAWRNQAHYGGFIYAAGAHRLFVNLFAPSDLRWKAEGTSVRQSTTFPDQESSLLVFNVRQPHAFTVSVRCPGWMEPEAMRLESNGQPVMAISRPGTYVDVTRNWQTGDRPRVLLPCGFGRS